MKTYFTSDEHHTHFNIIKYANRPFELSTAGVQKCTETIINNYNQIVKSEDMVFHLGDLMHGRNQSEEIITYIIKHMNGRKILIRGNHDNYSNEFYKSIGFEAVYDYLILNNIFINHYPCFLTEYSSEKELELINIFKQSRCKTIIHGHSHNKDTTNLGDEITRINVSVDYKPNNFKPLNLTHLIQP